MATAQTSPGISGFQYVGNPDFRGYLKAQSGPNSLADTVLNFVGNDGGYDPNKLAQYAAGPGGNDQASIAALKNYISKQYNTFKGLGTTPTNTTASTGLSPSELAIYQQEIGNVQDEINRLPNQQAAARNTIDSSFQSALKQLLLGKNEAQQQYTTTKQGAIKDFVGAKNTIGAQAGQTLSGLLRLLGSRGAGGGSAYNEAVPGAVARAATLQRAGVADQFGQNSQALDQNWGQYLNDYNSSVGNAGFQRKQQYSALDNSVDTNKASLLQTLAQLKAITTGSTAPAQPYLDQANSLLDKASHYSPASFSVNPKPYTAPSLASYTSTPITPTYNGQSATNDYYSPYLQSLLGKKQLATA